MSPFLVPDQQLVDQLVRCLFGLMFPPEPSSAQKRHEALASCLGQQLPALLPGEEELHRNILRLAGSGLDGLRENLLQDAGFILASDPAATGLGEVVAIYPGFYAIFCYRLAHLFTGAGTSLLPRMITEHAHRQTGIDIHPGAEIGVPFSIDHGTGIVIGETTIIGRRVKMYQGVTLGALSVDKSKAARKRHPTIEDDVILYAGCTILGGFTVVGQNSVIGGNVWLTESIGPGSVVYHKSEIVVRSQHPKEDGINFVI